MFRFHYSVENSVNIDCAATKYRIMSMEGRGRGRELDEKSRVYLCGITWKQRVGFCQTNNRTGAVWTSTKELLSTRPGLRETGVFFFPFFSPIHLLWMSKTTIGDGNNQFNSLICISKSRLNKNILRREFIDNRYYEYYKKMIHHGINKRARIFDIALTSLTCIRQLKSTITKCTLFLYVDESIM